MCSFPNQVGSLIFIVVYFFLHPSVLVYVLAKNWGCYPSKEAQRITLVCAPVPANATKSGIQYTIGCKNDKNKNDDDFTSPLLEKPLPKAVIVVIARLAEPAISWTCRVRRCPTMMLQGTNEGIRLSSVRTLLLQRRYPTRLFYQYHHWESCHFSSHGRIQSDIYPDSGSLFCLWLQEEVNDTVIYSLPPEERGIFTPASDLLHHPSFDRYFGSKEGVANVLKLNGEIGTGMVVLVFTDVVRSTDMYGKLGNCKALELVKWHFEILFAAFSRWGRVVKTIGDAVMAAFACPSAAIEAAAEALLEIHQLSEEAQRQQEEEDGIILTTPCFQIRIGIHAGKAVVVPLNGVNDYFGQTVNKAARPALRERPRQAAVSSRKLSWIQVPKLEKHWNGLYTVRNLKKFPQQSWI